MAQPLDTVAIALYNSLLAGQNFTVPTIDVSGPSYDIPGGASNPAFGEIPLVTVGMLTDAVSDSEGKNITGTGCMDVLMNTYMLHLNREYKNGRITGAEYTKAYIASIQYAAAAGIQFLLQKDQAYWQALTAQMNLINSRVQLAIGKTQLATTNIEANTAKVNYALTKAKLSSENAGYITVSEQGETARAQTKDTLSDGTAVMGVTKLQKDLLVTQNQVAEKQVILVSEQGEAQRAQTSDTRSDGAAVVGVLGKQKNLYTQQIESYKRDAEVKAGKMWVDAWITMKTIDEGLLPPDQFTNTEINEVLNAIKANNSIGS